MQNTAMPRWFAPIMAFCLSFIIIAGLAPSLGLQIDRQIDFWLLWLGTMILLALPTVFLEIALARRSKTSALNALSKLTRDADASQKWRVVGWLSVIFIPFLAGGVLYNLSQLTVLNSDIGFNANVVFAAAAVAACVLSFIPRAALIALTAVGAIASILLAQVFGQQETVWHVTALEFSEWGKATILALVASGLGLGLYWQSYAVESSSQTEAASKMSLPIWIAQLLAVIGFAYFSVSNALPAYSILITAVVAAALLLQLAKEQLQQRQVAVVLQWVLLLVALFIWAVPNLAQFLNPLLMLWGLVICLIYAIFTGWIMKISHLRKAMNFSNEIFYNIWRIAMRIVVPLAIVLAIISFVGQLI